MRHNKEEIFDYINCITFITKELLNKLEQIHTKNEQYFNDCGIFGVDRINTLKHFKELINDYKKEEIKKIEKYQGIKFNKKLNKFAKDYEKIMMGKLIK